MGCIDIVIILSLTTSGVARICKKGQLLLETPISRDKKSPLNYPLLFTKKCFL